MPKGMNTERTKFQNRNPRRSQSFAAEITGCTKKRRHKNKEFINFISI